jgi:primosomal protein N''
MKAPIASFLIAAFLVPATQSRLDSAKAALGPEPDVSSVWTGPVVRALSLGFSDFLADIYWLRAVQYYGRQKLEGAPTSYADLRPLLETAAELDPRFEMVYRYGAVFLSEPRPVGAGLPELGVGFLGKGADRNPADWRLRQEQGLFTFFYLNQAQRGAEILSRAARIPGAPYWMESLAAQIQTKGGELEAALSMWTVIYKQSEPGLLRDNAESQIKVAQHKMLVRDIQKQVRDYQARTGDFTSTLDQLKAKGVIPASRDEAGIPFDFQPATGTVTLSRDSPFWRR